MPKSSPKPIAKLKIQKKITQKQREDLIQTLKTRFEENKHRHPNVRWEKVQEKLEKNNEKLISLLAMEQTGGEPDVIGYDQKANEYTFCDCSAETPNRRNLCYDRAGEEQRLKAGIHPAGNAIDIAESMGVELIDEQTYRNLQQLGDFDTKTSSWLKTLADIRKLGGAIFGDKRYNHTFVYHNGAQSFYSSRGFRGMLKV